MTTSTTPFNGSMHMNVLLNILKQIYKDTSLGPLLGFKGGTAAHFFYGLDRLSVDLDFDLLDASKEDEVFKKIQNILVHFGKVKESRIKKNTLFFIVSYQEKTKGVKVEISRRSSESHYTLQHHFGIPMLVMVREDMFAHKLEAMLERKRMANRDIFDVWFFFENLWDINRAIVEKRSGVSFKDYLKKCITFVESISDHKILDGLGELLTAKQKIWAKANLLKETAFLLKAKLATEPK